MRVGFGTGRALSSEKQFRAPIASSDGCLVAHAINRGLSPIVSCFVVCPLLFRPKEMTQGVVIWLMRASLTRLQITEIFRMK